MCIRDSYKYVLDSTKPAQPGEIHVKASQVQDADNNVYGRYEVTWDEPNDKTASPAAYYRVEILPCNDAGTVAPDAVPYLKADVYQRSYTFVADKAWTGNFVVRVTPVSYTHLDVYKRQAWCWGSSSAALRATAGA